MTTEQMQSTPVVDRPEAFPMEIQGGMLEALGINMYTSIGKCLVEFIANAYDSDADKVSVSIPYDRIERDRRAARVKAKQEAKDSGADDFTVLLAPLPDEIVIEIQDDGHGMSPAEVRSKFMPINRKRRADASGVEVNLTTESGRRHVMGRKGLGKLAGFGAAEVVEVTTKKAGQSYATTFTMEYETLRNSPNLAHVQIPATYQDGLPLEMKGTTIRLRRLKVDAVKHTLETITDTISSAFFGIKPEDFRIEINGKAIEENKAAYEFVYSPDAAEDGFSTCTFEVEDVGEVRFDYRVQFRARAASEENPDLEFGSLPAAKRGARIYCNNRLAAGPSLFNLKTGMHNFYATDYLECVVRADEIDRRTIDFVNTNRTQLREDNEVVQTLVEQVTSIMARGIAAHAAWREEKVKTGITKKIQSSPALRWIEQMPVSQRKAAQRVLQAVAAVHDLNSPAFDEVAPHLMNAVNAGDVLVRLIELRHDAKSIQQVAEHLAELGRIERKNVLTHYRGRRSAIDALRNLVEAGEEAKRGGKRSEKQLHHLLKEQPWLVKPEYATFAASDSRMTTTLSKLAKELVIDEFAAVVEEDGADATRPDLVFILGNSVDPTVVNIVELKSPNIPLNKDHLTQLQRYMRQTREWLATQMQRHVTVHGMLVGQMPTADSRGQLERDLLGDINERGPSTQWEVVGLQEMLERTRTVHLEMIKALEEEEAEEEGQDAGAAEKSAA